MAKDLKKFANLTFLRTVDLDLMRRLLERHAHALHGLDMAVFGAEPEAVRAALRNYFLGPDDKHPEGLVADLFRIAELGNSNGLDLIIEGARRRGVPLRPEDESDETKLEPKQVALRFFLDHLEVFNAASDLLSYASVSAPTELRGMMTDVAAILNEETQAAFQREAERLFEADLRGNYCRIGWYDDDDKVNVIITHGAPLKTTEVIENGADKVTSFREITHAVLSYSATTGKIEVGKIAKGRAGDIAEIFARTMLKRPGFFEVPAARDLYTLAPVERAGSQFAINHAFDQGIRRVDIADVQVDRLALDPRSGRTRAFRSLIIRDSEGRALARLASDAPGVRFGPDWRLAQLSLRIQFDAGGRKPIPVKVTLRPPAIAKFKRHRFERRILELLRQNGLLRDQEFGSSAVAAE